MVLRTGRISETTLGHDLDVVWIQSTRLTTILRATARAMIATSRQEIQAVAQGPGPRTPLTISAVGSHHYRAIYADMPQALRTVRFRDSVEEPTLYTYRRQLERTGLSRSARLYVFPASAYHGELPDGYVLVGGADYNTYVTIASASNRVDLSYTDQYGRVQTYVTTARMPLMLARPEDLEEVR